MLQTAQAPKVATTVAFYINMGQMQPYKLYYTVYANVKAEYDADDDNDDRRDKAKSLIFFSVEEKVRRKQR